jgi:hypothetical protein
MNCAPRQLNPFPPPHYVIDGHARDTPHTEMHDRPAIGDSYYNLGETPALPTVVVQWKPKNGVRMP